MKVLNKIKYLVKNFYNKHFISKLIITIVGCGILVGFICYIPVLSVKEYPLTDAEYIGLSPSSKEISLDAGEILVAESNSKQLYLNSKTMNLKLKDKNTGKIWNSTVPGATQSSELALLSVSYLGEDNNLYEWDTYQYCTAIGSYNLYQIDNGVQIKMNINEGESNRFYEYYPEKMTTDRFENFFILGMDTLVEEGKIDKEKAEKYEQTLKLIYKKSVTEDCYDVAYNGTPPTSAVKQLLDIADLLGYTREMLIEDSEAMGLTVTFVQPAAFNITVEATLDEDDLIVRVPTQEMESVNDYYTIQNIEVLPNFGTTTAKDYEDGYIFVPDGAGALFEFNTFSATVPEYIRPVYDNDYYSDYYYMPEYGEELMMPIFGMTYGQDEKATHGFMGIIEQGAETSYINVKLADGGEDSNASYNKAYASFDATQYHKVNVYGPYSDNQATYLADTGVLDVDYCIRYKLFPDTVTYYDMAMTYQEYLMQKWGIKELSYPENAKLYLDFIGAVSLKKRVLGIPYDSSYSMTTYNELIDIIDDLGDTNLVLQYSGVFNGGLKNKLTNQADLVSSNGSNKDLANLMERTEKSNIDLFLEAPFTKVYDSGNGFLAKKHSIYDYSNGEATIYRYLPSLGVLNGIVDSDVGYYNIVSPRYLSGVIKGFMKDADQYENLSIPDLANFYYADYRYNKTISPYEASNMIDKNLQLLSSEKKLSLYNPTMKNLVYGAYAEDISRESSNYATFYATIPFRQLVMNGLIGVTTENVNMSSDNYDYYILQAVELGVYPKFTLTAQNVDALKDSEYSYYYSTEYSKQKDIINKVYSACQTAWKDIGTMEIINHKQLLQNVFCTEYASGVSVITNYNLYSVDIDGNEIEAHGYLLVRE